MRDLLSSFLLIFVVVMAICCVVAIPISGLSALDCSNYQKYAKAKTEYSILSDTCYVELPSGSWIARDKFEMSTVLKE